MALASELLPLDAIRRELRIPPGENDEDELVSAQAEAALQEIQSRSGVALIDATETVAEDVSGLAAAPTAVRIRASSPRRVTRASWIDRGGRDVPIALDGAWAPRVVPVRTNRFGVGEYLLSGGAPWPGWPAGGAEALTYDLLCGVAAADAPRALIQGAIVLMRSYYDERPDPRADAAVTRLLAPFVLQ